MNDKGLQNSAYDGTPKCQDSKRGVSFPLHALQYPPCNFVDCWQQDYLIYLSEIWGVLYLLLLLEGF